jgi:hypothetical protein
MTIVCKCGKKFGTIDRLIGHIAHSIAHGLWGHGCKNELV